VIDAENYFVNMTMRNAAGLSRVALMHSILSIKAAAEAFEFVSTKAKRQ
jgi:hypothetical protein